MASTQLSPPRVRLDEYRIFSPLFNKITLFLMLAHAHSLSNKHTHACAFVNKLKVKKYIVCSSSRTQLSKVRTVQQTTSMLQNNWTLSLAVLRLDNYFFKVRVNLCIVNDRQIYGSI